MTDHLAHHRSPTTLPPLPPHPHRRSRDPAPEVPERVRMPLLTLITQQSLDEDYEAAARKRAAGAPRPPRGRSRRTAAVVVAVFGLLVTTAALQTHRNAGADDASRASLISSINRQKAIVARQQVREDHLVQRNAVTQRGLVQLTVDQQAAQGRNERLQASTGFGPVAGEGIRVTVTQRANADQNQEVQASDLAVLVNGLFAAGAEAVAINGQRIAAETSLHYSGPAIYVDDAGVEPPYVVSAIGDRGTLEARFYDTSSGLDFAASADRYGFAFTVDNEASMTLPGASPSLRVLHSARIMSQDPRKEPTK